MMDHGVIQFAECRLAHHPLTFAWVVLSHPNSDSCHPFFQEILQWLQESLACHYTRTLGFCWLLLNHYFWLGKRERLGFLCDCDTFLLWFSWPSGWADGLDISRNQICLSLLLLDFFLFFWWGKLADPDLLWQIICKSSALWSFFLFSSQLEYLTWKRSNFQQEENISILMYWL